MTDHDTTIREAQEWARAIINPGLSQQGGLLHVNRLLAVIEQQQAETLRQGREYALAHAESAGHPEDGQPSRPEDLTSLTSTDIMK